MIHSPYDTIHIANMLFRLEIISNCTWIILWWSTEMLNICHEMVHSHSLIYNLEKFHNVKSFLFLQ